jgi:putative ABC transport system permease protein
MMIILYVKDEVSYDRFHANLNNIYRIGARWTNEDGKQEGMSGITGYLQGPRFTASIPEIRGFVRLQSDRTDIKTGTDIKWQDIHKVDSNFLSVFSFPLLSGDPRTALLSPNAIVISEDVATKQFGTTQALGKTIMLKEHDDAFKPYTVTGVAKRCPQNSSIKFEVLMPINVSAQDEANDENWFNFSLNTFVILTPGADARQVEAKMQKVYEADAAAAKKIMQEKYGDNSRTFYHLQPFPELHLSREYNATGGLVDGSNPMYSYILSGIALFILLIACINFVNLTIARSLKRAKEIGIRKVVGGGRGQLIMQFMGESLILSFAAFVLALIFVQLSLPMFNELSNKALALSYLFDAKLVTGYILLFLTTTLLAGFYPSMVLSGYNPVKVLYSRFTLSGKNYLQKGLVILQFTLASFLIIATITIYTQFNYLMNEKLGYDDKHLVMVPHGRIPHQQSEHIREELMKHQGITQVAFRNGGDWGTTAHVNGETMISFTYETVDENYVPLLKIPVVAGRNFSKLFPSDSTHAVLVNQAFAKEAGWKNPVGQVVDFWYNPGEKYTVVGVVKDYHFASLTSKIGPQLFTMKPGNQYGRTFIKIRPGTETAALHHIENVFRAIFPLNPYNYSFKDEENRRHYESEAKWKQIMLFSAVLTIFISCIGLFGLSVLAAEKRTKEIGIRKVLGASVSTVVTILSKDFLKLVMISLVLAMPIAWLAGNKWLENYPYRISLSWWMFALAAVLVAVIALVTVSCYALKAAVADPVKSLKRE